MKLALQGVSVIFASGDSGVANRYNSGYNNSCLNSEYGYVDENGTRFSPSFPANCPYVSPAYNFRLPARTNLDRSLQLAQQHSSTPPSMVVRRQLLRPTVRSRTTLAVVSPASSHARLGNRRQWKSISASMCPSTTALCTTLPVVPTPMSRLWVLSSQPCGLVRHTALVAHQHLLPSLLASSTC